MPDMGNIRIKDENMNKTTIITNVQTRLFELQDLKYRDFHAKLMPTVNKEKIIGVRTPALRVFAKKYGKTDEAKEYLQILPHQYYEENNLHGLLIEQIKDYDTCLEELERFLPYIDNWATCDMLAVKVVKNHLDTFIDEVYRWMESDHAYTIRFGISMLMRYYLEDAFQMEYPEKVAQIRSEEYYVNMMCAWYFATALAKQYDKILPFIEKQKLDVWTHNKTIQKAIESYRITPEQKEYLRGLKIKK
jgi:3-methyladenine DNA glycosylase AlkD